jgi:hypothetical protein
VNGVVKTVTQVLQNRVNRAILIAFVFQGVALMPSAFSREAITNPLREDGYGSQFQTIVYSVIYAELNDRDFFYSPFLQMEHNYDGDVDFLKKKEELINFIGNFELKDSETISSPRTPGEYIEFFEHNIEAAVNSLSLKKIKGVFRENKNRGDYFNNESLNIVIHIRRKNVQDNRSEGTTVPDRIYLNMIRLLRDLYCSENPRFHLLSQGDVNDFLKVFCSGDITLHINETIEKTFISMVLADVLVTAPSSMSYTAGILSEGIIYYMPFWHPPLPNWIRIEQLGLDEVFVAQR